MQEITVYDKNEHILTYLTQWDKNVVIKLKNPTLENAEHIHFFNCNSKEAMVMSATYKNGILSSQVPNDLLTEPHAITGYIWVNDNPKDIGYETAEHKSICGFRLMVRKCPKPSNQVYKDQKEFITFEKILSEADKYALRSKSYAVGGTASRNGEETDNARYYKTEAGKSASGAAASASNAASSADNAAKSANNAKTSENEVNRLADEVSANAKIVQNTTNEALSIKTISNEFAVLAESFAHGGTETRAHEATDNARYYCEQSQNNSEISKAYLEKIEDAGNEAVDAIKNALDMDKPNFQMDLSTGNLMYEGGRFVFQVNKAGHLEWGLSV